MATTTRATNSARPRSAGSDGVVRELSRTARRATRPAAAAGAAAGGLALGVRLRVHWRPHLRGLPLPRSREVRALREQADASRRQSPIEVVLSALTSRRLPRKT